MTPEQIEDRLARIVELERRAQSEELLIQLSVERVALIKHLDSVRQGTFTTKMNLLLSTRNFH